MSGKRTSVVMIAVALLLYGLAGCASEPEQAKQAGSTAAGGTVSQVPAGTSTTQGDMKTLVDGRAQDGKVLDDANKAVGALHP